MRKPSRRDFVTQCALAAGALCTAGMREVLAAPPGAAATPGAAGARASASGPVERDWARPASYFKKLDGKRIECELCPQKCRVADQERGTCGVRENRAGEYYTLVHSRVCAVHTDPIEKKPLFHFLPATTTFSLATAGCNMSCRFCQNWNISQFRPEQVENVYLPPADVVRNARARGASSVAFTYSEPVVFTEYVLDCAKAGNDAGIPSVIISNGFIQETPLRDLCKALRAIKVDLKAFTEDFYKTQCGGALKPVLDSLRIIKDQGTWLELVVLVIPTLNDSRDEIASMAAWVRKELGAEVPIHFTRFSPDNSYLLKNLPPTPIATLEMARNTALEAGLSFVYTGNIPGHPGENTYCPACKEVLIARRGFTVVKNEIRKGKCGACGRAIPGVWSM